MTTAKPLITGTTIAYLAYAGIIVAASAAALFVDPMYVLAALVALLGLFLIFRYPFFGSIVYLVIYFVRPGERFEALAPLRIELTFGLVLLLAIVISDALRGTRVRFPQDRVSVALLAFIATLWIGVVFSIWKQQSLDAMIAFVKTFVLYYFLVVMADTEKRFQIVFWLIVLLTSAVGLESLVNYFTGGFSFNQGVMRAGGATSFGEHSNSLAMYMATTVPMLIYLIARYRHPLSRLLCFGLMGVCFVTLIITGSRSGVLCLLGTALAYAWFSHRRLVYIAGIVGLSIATWVALPEQYKARYGTIASNEVDASSQGRLDAWAAGMRMFIDRPITGVGPQAFAAAYLEREGVWLYAHSLYVELIASMGILGTFAWGWFLWELFRYLRRMRNSPPPGQFWERDCEVFVLATYAILAGLLVAGVFGHILFRDTWYVIAALVVARAATFPKAETTL